VAAGVTPNAFDKSFGRAGGFERQWRIGAATARPLRALFVDRTRAAQTVGAIPVIRADPELSTD